MQRIKTILCPVDFSEFSVMALRYATAFAQLYRARLIVYYCIPSIPEIAGFSEGLRGSLRLWRDDVTERLEVFVKPYLPYHIEVCPTVGAGSPADGILRQTVEENADLIVMGTHGIGGCENNLMGSVTNRVLHMARVPVLTVCKPTRTLLSGDPDEPLLIGKILCAVDPAEINLKMLGSAMSLARSYRSTIVFFSVEENGQHESVQESLQDLIQPDKEELCRVEFSQSRGNPVKEILKAIRAQEADLVIMGHHTQMDMTLEVSGSVTLRVIPESPCPVFVVTD